MIGHDPTPSGPWNLPRIPTPPEIEAIRQDRRASSSTTRRAPTRQDSALILDMNPARAGRLAFRLQELGLRPLLVEDVADAMHQISTVPPGMLVLQVPLCEMSEVVFLETVRRLAGPRGIPVVVTSEVYDGSGPEIRSLLQRGAVAFLPPPEVATQWRSVLAQVGLLPGSSGESRPAVSGATTTDRPLRRPVPGRRRPPAPSQERLHRRAERPQGARLPRDRRGALAAAARVPTDAVEGTLHFGQASELAFAWDCRPGTLTVVCGSSGPDVGQDIRLQLRLREAVDDAMVDRSARILGTVQHVTSRPWGNLVQLRIRGAVPPSDFEAILTQILRVGPWNIS